MAQFAQFSSMSILPIGFLMVLGLIGSLGDGFNLPSPSITQPLMVSGTDTKKTRHTQITIGRDRGLEMNEIWYPVTTARDQGKPR